jgi:hypothetical protein
MVLFHQLQIISMICHTKPESHWYKSKCILKMIWETFTIQTKNKTSGLVQARTLDSREATD